MIGTGAASPESLSAIIQAQSASDAQYSLLISFHYYTADLAASNERYSLPADELKFHYSHVPRALSYK